MLDHLASFVTRAGDGMRRVRRRRADLRRMPAAEMVSDRPSLRQSFQWLPAVRAGGRSHAALVCYPNSRVTYNVTLPGNATVVSWCTLVAEPRARRTGSVEFEIQVSTEGRETSHRRVVDPASRFGRRWHLLRLNGLQAGAARIVLSTRRTDGAGPHDDVQALWGSPHIEVPRSPGDLVRALRSAIAEIGLRGLWYKALPPDNERLYRLWVRENEPSRMALHSQRQWALGRTRSFSLITFVAAPSAWRSERVAASLERQSYPSWEWIIVTTDDSMNDVRALMARTAPDPRVRVLRVPSGATPADAWNAALGEARGEFAALLGHRDALAPAALYEVASALEQSPDCDLLYSDEDRLTDRDRRHRPRFKPDWSPEHLLSSNYIGRLAMIRVATALAAGGFRGSYDTVEEWDLLLRLSRFNARIRRVPRCLYHRDEADVAGDPVQEGHALRNHCEALGLPVTVSKPDGTSRVAWAVNGQPRVSVVIPNRDAAAVFRQCVSGLLERTRYPHLELVVVDNGSTDTEVLDLYRSLERTKRGRVVPFDRPFNFSAACNAGAAEARGELLLFLNNDIEVIDPDWLDELVRWAQRPEIGIVGAKLLYPDRTIQHAGVVFGIGLVGHVFSRAPEGTSGLFGSPESYRNYLAVTGACQIMRSEVFKRLGGYDERFRISFSDVVLCMEAWRTGYRVVYTPHARLVHHESYTRKRDDSAQDMELLARYLRANGFVEDPFLHPELNPKSFVPALRPPFDPVPRQVVHDYLDRVLAADAH